MHANPMLARDLMTTDVVTVPASMPVTSLARLLADRGISSAPVTDAQGSLLGIVTEADLLRRVASAEDAPAAGWLRSLFGFRNADLEATQYARTHGSEAGAAMTTDLVTVDRDATAEHCAHLMERHRVKRLPVLQDGRLVGVVSRADLLRAALDRPPGSAARAKRATTGYALRCGRNGAPSHGRTASTPSPRWRTAW